MAAVVRVEDLPSAGRRTLTPSTAVRAVRFRGTAEEYRRSATPSCVSRSCGRQESSYRREPFRLARDALFERWIASNSSRLRPEPTATQVSGLSAR